MTPTPLKARQAFRLLQILFRPSQPSLIVSFFMYANAKEAMNFRALGVRTAGTDVSAPATF